MAKKALIEKQQRKPKFKVRAYTRCRRCGPTRVGYKIDAGEKVRVCKKCGQEV